MVDCSGDRYDVLQLYHFHRAPYMANVYVTLYDDQATPAQIRWKTALNEGWKWHRLPIPVGSGLEIASKETTGQWYYFSGSGFTWKIKKLHVRLYLDLPSPSYKFYLDYLTFTGGKRIDPWQSENPPIIDTASIASHGRRLYNYEDDQIRSFEQAQTIGAYVLDVLKNPLKRVSVGCKQGYPWAKPSQTLTLTLPQYNISSETWRITSVTHEWSAQRKKFLTGFDLVKQYERVSGWVALSDTLAGLIKGRY